MSWASHEASVVPANRVPRQIENQTGSAIHWRWLWIVIFSKKLPTMYSGSVSQSQHFITESNMIYYKLYIYIYSGNTWKKHIDFIVMMCTVMPLLVLLLRHAVWNDTLQRLNATTALLRVNKQRQCKCEPSLQQYRRISVWAVDFS